MNKAKLVERIAFSTEMKKSEVEKMLDHFTKVVHEAVKAGDKVAIPGLGTFEKIYRKPRKGINPATQQVINIPGKNAPKFKAAKAFKQAVE